MFNHSYFCIFCIIYYIPSICIFRENKISFRKDKEIKKEGDNSRIFMQIYIFVKVTCLFHLIDCIYILILINIHYDVKIYIIFVYAQFNDNLPENRCYQSIFYIWLPK